MTLGGTSAPVDTGFLVFNDRTYPNLVALLAHLGVPHALSNMSFSVRVDEEKLEWAGSNLATIFAQKRNLIKPEFWRIRQREAEMREQLLAEYDALQQERQQA